MGFKQCKYGEIERNIYRVDLRQRGRRGAKPAALWFIVRFYVHCPWLGDWNNEFENNQK